MSRLTQLRVPDQDAPRAPTHAPGPGPLWRAVRPHRPTTPPVPAARKAETAPPEAPRTDRDPLQRRIVSIQFEDLAIARWLRWAAGRQDAPPDDLPVALSVEGPHGPIVHAVNRAARMAGIQPGARVVDMRALCPALRVAWADTDGDRMALERLMLWARRWCPWTALDGDDGLVLDTTGSDHLWGGEAALLREIEGQFSLLGLSTRLAMAPTHGAAWALARFGPVRAVVTPDGLAQATAPLPARALRLEGDTVLLLQRLGLKTIGDLAAVPRVSLARRFATTALPQNPLARLDQLQGRLPEPVNAEAEPPRFAVQARLAEPVQDPTAYLPDLCKDLCDALGAAGFGARRVTVTVYRTDGEVSQLSAATARPSRDPAHLMRLWGDRLDRIDPGFGFDLITLSADMAEDMRQVQTWLDGRADDGAQAAQLIDRLVARLGHHAVQVPAPLPSHLPERAAGWLPAMSLHDADPAALAAQDRPPCLFDNPEEIRVLYAVPEGPPAQFVWRKQTHRVTRFAGPERIAPEWWNDRPGTRLRDYYRVEAQAGHRLWIYRDGVLGDDRGDVPRWFVHGCFG
ncbi:DNA polymerase Y family protein [Loktanella sp. 3ANDIMAR09]|uniref:Y-family DNA polymerase n=1 Tax=Loktanella sp. 3ANDIMAR09 TaxID=1225657 RepID=UPI0009FA1DEB|nr:DNA polymerase Y family protein [Loktanella sp. 3ANDIMAR09]